MTNKPIDGLAASFLIVFSILLGLNQVLVKLVNIGMHPIFQVAMRSALAIIPILIYCYFTKKKINFFDGSFLPGVIHPRLSRTVGKLNKIHDLWTIDSNDLNKLIGKEFKHWNEE